LFSCHLPLLPDFPPSVSSFASPSLNIFLKPVGFPQLRKSRLIILDFPV
jgi:hypothetical protein